MIFATFIACRAAEPDAALRKLEAIRDVDSLQLGYRASSAGIAMLRFSSNLTMQPVLLELYSISNAQVLSRTVTNEQAGNGFFSVIERPGDTLDDYIDEEPEYLEPDVSFHIEAVEPLNEIKNGTLRLLLRVVNASHLVTVTNNGLMTFMLGNSVGPLSEDNIFPRSLPMKNGIVNGTIEIHGLLEPSSNLSLFVQSLEFDDPGVEELKSESMQRQASTRKQNISNDIAEPRKALSEYADDIWDGNTAFQHPLGATVKINGSYGEYRAKTKDPSDSSGRPHLGLDLDGNQGQNVFPIRRGIISFVSTLETKPSERYAMVNHGNGFSSLYRHILPSLVKGTTVYVNTPIGTIARHPNGDHLHLEIYEGTGILEGYLDDRKRINNPISVNPLNFKDGFSPPLISPGVNDNAAPLIKGMFSWSNDPENDEFNHSDTVKFDRNSKFLVFEIADLEQGQALLPSSIQIDHEGSGGTFIKGESFTFETERTVRSYFQPLADNTFGYVRKMVSTTAGTRGFSEKELYQFYYKWDTTQYKTEPNGPRRIRVTLKDHVPNLVVKEFTFGPLIDAPSVVYIPPEGTNLNIRIANMCGPLPSGMIDIPKSHLSVTLDTAGTAAYRASLDLVEQRTEIEHIAQGHNNFESVKLFIKPLEPADSIQEIRITAASHVFTNLAHTKRIVLSPFPINVDSIVQGIYGSWATNNGYTESHLKERASFGELTLSLPTANGKASVEIVSLNKHGAVFRFTGDFHATTAPWRSIGEAVGHAKLKFSTARSFRLAIVGNLFATERTTSTSQSQNSVARFFAREGNHLLFFDETRAGSKSIIWETTIGPGSFAIDYGGASPPTSPFESSWPGSFVSYLEDWGDESTSQHSKWDISVDLSFPIPGEEETNSN